ncbi:MAG: SRPBCC family protein [Solirubrobacteraceae bacterium]
MSGTASGTVTAPVQRCLELLEAIDGYPRWHPEVVRSVVVLERSEQGAPTKARATLHASLGPFTKDLELELAVQVQAPGTVKLTRLSGGASDGEGFEAVWHVHEQGKTRIELALNASLDVPRLIPVRGLGDAMAADFVAAATRALAPQRR